MGTSASRPVTKSRNLDGVAGGVDEGVRSAQVFVHQDAPSGAESQTGLAGQAGLGSNPNAQDYHLGRDGSSVSQAYAFSLPGALDSRRLAVEMQFDPLLAHVLMDNGCHFTVQGAHHLVGGLHHMDLHPAGMQAFGHLQTDKAGTHHYCTGWLLDIDISFDHVAVRDIADGKHIGQFDAGDIWNYGRRTGGEDHVVIALPVGFTAGQILDFHLFDFREDAHHLAHGADIDIEAAFHGFGGLHQQTGSLGDDSADVVRQAAIGKRNVFAPFEHDDLGLFVKSPQTGGGAGSSSHPANNNYLHAIPP